MSENILYLPPTSPDPSSHHPGHRPELTSEQSQKLGLLIQHLNSESFALPSTVKEVKAAQKWRAKNLTSKNAADKEYNVYTSWIGRPLDAGEKKSKCTPLTDEEKAFLTSEQCQRFLRAVKWDLANAFSRTEETVTWRREFEVVKLNNDASIVYEEAATGKEVLLGWDIHKRPCLYMFPWRQNTKTSERQIQFVVWCLERALDLMPPNVENLCLLIDFGAAGKGGGGPPTSLGQAKKFLEIVQTYYGERLGRAICINVPMLFWGFYRLVGPFVDPVTKDKIRFNPDVRTLVPPAQLDKEIFGGDYNFRYKHEEYFPFFDKMCRERREAKLRRWQEKGEGKCGMSEFVIKGGDEETPEAEDPSATEEEEKEGSFRLPPEAETAPDYVEPTSDTASPVVPDGSANASSASSVAAPVTEEPKSAETNGTATEGLGTRLKNLVM